VKAIWKRRCICVSYICLCEYWIWIFVVILRWCVCVCASICAIFVMMFNDVCLNVLSHLSRTWRKNQMVPGSKIKSCLFAYHVREFQQFFGKPCRPDCTRISIWLSLIFGIWFFSPFDPLFHFFGRRWVSHVQIGRGTEFGSDGWMVGWWNQQSKTAPSVGLKCLGFLWLGSDEWGNSYRVIPSGKLT